MRRFPFALLLSVLVSCAVPSIRADVVSFTAQGSIVLVANDFTSDIQVGDTFSYTFSYDTGAASNGGSGVYQQYPLTSTAVTISGDGGARTWSSTGPFTGSSDPLHDQTVTVLNFNPDTITVSSKALDASSLTGAGSFAGETFSIVFASLSLQAPNTLLSSPALPSSFNLADFYPYAGIDPSSAFVLSTLSSQNANLVIRGQITSLAATSAVPEPSACALVLAAAGLGVACWRRRAGGEAGAQTCKAIARGEDRELFEQGMLEIDLDVARSRPVKSREEARA